MLKSKNWNDFWDFISNNIVPSLIVFAGIIATFLQFFGILEKISPTLSTAMVIGLLSFLAAEEIVERQKKLGQILEAIEKIPKLQVKILDEPDRWYEYVGRRIRQAKSSIDDAALSSRSWSRTTDAAKFFYDIREKKIANSHFQGRYRYLTVFNDQRDIGRLQDVRKNLKSSLKKDNNDNINYYAAYLPKSKFPSRQNDRKISFPMLNFVIIDEEEVIVGFYKLTGDIPGAIKDDKAITLKNLDIVNMFREYFEHLWRNEAIIIRANDDRVFEDIHKQLED